MFHKESLMNGNAFQHVQIVPKCTNDSSGSRIQPVLRMETNCAKRNLVH